MNEQEYYDLLHRLNRIEGLVKVVGNTVVGIAAFGGAFIAYRQSVTDWGIDESAARWVGALAFFSGGYFLGRPLRQAAQNSSTN